ncbi:MAG: histidine phosphatase family protein [Syntrophomonadaceae bacterium]|nr:histidine phosphatase family protein [Syntrophomonadaceae bacterium]
MEQKLIYLVRHGKIELEDDHRRYIGQIDPPLCKEGKEQARSLGDRLNRVKIEGVFCSDLSRSVDTAREIAVRHGLISQERADLREISLGRWEGLKFAEVARCYPKEFKERGADIGYFRPPGGESFADCSGRVVAAFHEIVQSPFNSVAIVGHAGINRLIICHILGLPLANLFRISQDYACLNIIMAGDFGFRLKLLNQTTIN